MTPSPALILVAAAAVATVSAAQPPGGEWRRVTDGHGSSVEVPAALQRGRGDPTALTFAADDGARVTFETVTESRPGFPGNDPAGDMAAGKGECGVWPPPYRIVKATLAAYSCVKADTVIYYVARYGPSGSVVLHATYPKAHAALWDNSIARMSTSMRQVPRSERR